MTDKQKQIQNKDTATEKKHGLSKRTMITLGVCVGLLMGAGGTIGMMAADTDFHPAVMAAKKQAKLSDIKVDQNTAVDKFNQKYQNKQLSEISLDDEHGKYVYEVKGFDDTKEYEVKVNAKTGKVVKSESEKRDRGEEEYQLDPGKVISRDEASKIAEDAAKKGKSREWELKQEKDKAVWEVKVVDGRHATEVTIDAGSKAVISTEKDNN